MNQYNLKNIKADFKAKGIFYTQRDLAEFMKSLIDVDFFDVYDPTCGDGSLLSVFPKEMPKYGQEINKHQLDIACQRLENFSGVAGDTLNAPAFMDRQFSCIVANPPFSISWNPPAGLFKDERFLKCPIMPPKSKADFAFILHIIHLLKTNGIAVVLNFPGILYRGNSEGQIRKWLIEQNLIEKVILVPSKKFVDTNISTCCIVFKKNRIATDIEFIDQELGISKKVSLEEIAKNDFNLSVSSYVIKETYKEYLDPILLQSSARKQMLNKIKSDIQMDRIICELEGYDFNEYLSDLSNLIESYK